jgi:hypothetical protein
MEDTNRFSKVRGIIAGRKSNIVINLALIGNAFLTFMFAFNYLPSLFDMFGAADDENAMLITKFVAGFFAVVVFDLAFYAWGQIERREGNSEEQISTANTAKKMALWGSLAASAGQFVLSQTAAAIPQTIVYIVSFLSTVAVAAVAIMHMKWWSQYNDESFESQEKGHVASTTARQKSAAQKEAEDLADLRLKQADHEHTLAMEQLRAEMQLDVERIKSEQVIKLQLLQQEIEHEQAVAKQTRELLQQRVLQDANRIAGQKADRLVEKFLARHGANQSNGSAD